MMKKWLIVSVLAFLMGNTAIGKGWESVKEKAKGQTIYFNAWGGSTVINDYIQWAARVVYERYGVRVKHVKVTDIGTVISRILAEKSAGRDTKGTVDAIWINGENFRSMKVNNLLYGPFSQKLPNYQLVDTENKPTILYDFTVPVDNLEAPWGMAQLVFMYDSAEIRTPPDSMVALLQFAKSHPGRFTYPSPPNFHGTTFIKQALIELATDPAALYEPVDPVVFEAVTAPLWHYLDELRPLLWRGGITFPQSAPEMTRLLNDGEIFISLSFNPNEASNAITTGELPDTVRTYIHQKGTIGNTHFLAIPYNSSAKEGAEVFINFLMSPEAQARKSNPDIWGDPTILAVSKLSKSDQAEFDRVPLGIATLSAEALKKVLLEPHVSWVESLEKAWITRYSK